MSSRILEWLRKYDVAVANGRAKDRVEGNQSRLIRQIYSKLCKGKEVAWIAEDLEEDEIRV